MNVKCFEHEPTEITEEARLRSLCGLLLEKETFGVVLITLVMMLPSRARFLK